MIQTTWQTPMPWHKEAIIVKPNVRHWSRKDNKRFAELFVSLSKKALLERYPNQTLDGLKARAWRLGLRIKDQGKSLDKSA